MFLKKIFNFLIIEIIEGPTLLFSDLSKSYLFKIFRKKTRDIEIEIPKTEWKKLLKTCMIKVPLIVLYFSENFTIFWHNIYSVNNSNVKMDKKSSHVKPIKYPRSNFTILQRKTRNEKKNYDDLICKEMVLLQTRIYFGKKKERSFFTILGWLVRCQHFNNKL